MKTSVVLRRSPGITTTGHSRYGRAGEARSIPWSCSKKDTIRLTSFRGGGGSQVKVVGWGEGMGRMRLFLSPSAVF